MIPPSRQLGPCSHGCGFMELEIDHRGEKLTKRVCRSCGAEAMIIVPPKAEEARYTNATYSTYSNAAYPYLFSDLDPHRRPGPDMPAPRTPEQVAADAELFKTIQQRMKATEERILCGIRTGRWL